MFQRHLIGRTLQAGACGAAILFCANAGRAEVEKPKDKRACKVTWKTAQDREKAGRLREAASLLQACSSAPCSAPMKKQCIAKATQLGPDIPSIVPIVTDETGARDDVQVKMDGEVLTSRLDGRAIAVDPGMHEFSFATSGGVLSSQKIMIVQGQRNRTIAVSLGTSDSHGDGTLAASIIPAPPVETPTEPAPTAEKVARKPAPEPQPAPEPAPPETRRHGRGPGALPYIVGGTGLVAIGAGATLVVWGRKDNDLLSRCSPNCKQSSVDHVRNLYVAANIAIGAGVVALGVATVLFATSSRDRAPAGSAYVFDIQPTPAGAFASVSGKF